MSLKRQNTQMQMKLAATVARTDHDITDEDAGEYRLAKAKESEEKKRQEVIMPPVPGSHLASHLSSPLASALTSPPTLFSPLFLSPLASHTPPPISHLLPRRSASSSSGTPPRTS